MAVILIVDDEFSIRKTLGLLLKAEARITSYNVCYTKLLRP